MPYNFSDGDWTCTKCDNINFARRGECNRCGTQKPAGAKKVRAGGTKIGKQAAEKSRGLFSADDWQCKTCGNVNWARRGDCNMCQTPKFGVQEERTGLGGGFNERDNVEYNETVVSSDDEYDIYGRKKRKKSENMPVLKEPKAKATSYAIVDYDDDESSEDGDLSKYNFDEDDDEEDVDVSKYDLLDDSTEEKEKEENPVEKLRKSPECSSSNSSKRSRYILPRSASSGSDEVESRRRHRSRSNSRKRTRESRHSRDSRRRTRSRSRSRTPHNYRHRRERRDSSPVVKQNSYHNRRRGG